MSWKEKYGYRPEVNIQPSKDRPKGAICEEIGKALANQDKFFQRSNLVYRISENDLEGITLKEVQSEEFETGLDQYITPVIHDDKEAEKRAEKRKLAEKAELEYKEPKDPCTKYANNVGWAKRLIKSQEFKEQLPECKSIFNCPIDLGHK